MYERFTDRARKVISFANQEAIQSGHEFLGTEHVLLGLAKEGSGVAANVLKTLGVGVSRIRREVEKIVQKGSVAHPEGHHKLPPTPRVKKVFEYAVEEARLLQHSYIGTEHLLLGLLREGESAGCQVLVNLGVKLEEVRQKILDLLGYPLENDGSPADAFQETSFWQGFWTTPLPSPNAPIPVEETMVRVRLETAAGDYVCIEDIPTFLTPPEVLIWGQRYFRLHSPGIYREAFAYCVTGRERGLL